MRFMQYYYDNCHVNYYKRRPRCLNDRADSDGGISIKVLLKIDYYD